MARIKTSDETLDYFDALDDLSEGALDGFKGSRSEEEELSDLFDDPIYSDQDDDLDEDDE
jgi:hypothetical protein